MLLVGKLLYIELLVNLIPIIRTLAILRTLVSKRMGNIRSNTVIRTCSPVISVTNYR